MPLSGISFGSTAGTHKFSLSVRFGKAVPQKASWELGEDQTGAELEKMQERANQAEEAARVLQEQIIRLEDELIKQRQVQTTVSTAAAGIAPPDSRDIQRLEEQIRDLRQQLEKTVQQKPAEPVQAKPEFGKISTGMDTEKARELFREGMRYYSLHQLEKAVQVFRKSLESDPANEWVKKSLERTLTELGQEKARQKPAPEYQMIRYVARKGDTLKSLAKQFYGDAGKWPVIRDANPKFKEQQIPEGTAVVIPQIPEITVPVPEDRP